MDHPLAPKTIESLLPTKSHPGPGIRLRRGRETAMESRHRLVQPNSTQFNSIQPYGNRPYPIREPKATPATPGGRRLLPAPIQTTFGPMTKSKIGIPKS
jgi:hypothetical protein